MKNNKKIPYNLKTSSWFICLLGLRTLDLPFLEIKGYKNRDHNTAWVEYKDKRTGTPFYYNPVSTVIQYCSLTWMKLM